MMEGADRYELYRVATDMEALTDAIRERVEDLNVSRTEIDEAGQLLPGYAAKLLCDPPMRGLGQKTLGPVLKATGLALIVVIDDERFAPLKDTLTKRKRTVRPNGSIKRPHWLITKEISQKMQVLRNQKLSPDKRRAIARKAIRTRWSKRRRRAIVPAGS